MDIPNHGLWEQLHPEQAHQKGTTEHLSISMLWTLIMQMSFFLQQGHESQTFFAFSSPKDPICTGIQSPENSLSLSLYLSKLQIQSK